MKKRNLIIIAVISVILVVVGLVTSYIDSARVRNAVEPKFTLKIISNDGNKITYWGLGYKVIRYPAVSPKESFKSSLGVKFGSWFMNYKLSNYENIDIENLMDRTTTQVTKTRDIEFIISLVRDSKYINELCNGIRTHKIKIDNEEYQLIEGCAEIQKGKKQAQISKEDLNKFLKIIDDYNENNEETDEKDTQVVETINTKFATYHKMSDGTWQCNGNSYKYKLEITGKMSSAAKSSTFVYLSNIEDIPFERAYKAAGFSSSTMDYFSIEDAIFIDCYNVE